MVSTMLMESYTLFGDGWTVVPCSSISAVIQGEGEKMGSDIEDLIQKESSISGIYFGTY